jgi:D-alanyl-D-alanine dipeptidase
MCSSRLALALAVGACGGAAAASHSVEAPPAEIAPDAAAESLLVDLTLVDLETGAEIPMGTPFDSFAPEAHTANADGEVARHRQALVQAMESEGFTNYQKEWWHFSFQVEGAVPFDRVIR